MEDPHVLLRRLKLGREEYCQRLLTMLILEGAYPRWNTRSAPSPAGLAWLRAVDVLAFGAADLAGDIAFVDEFDLAPRFPDERGGAPDYAVLARQRLWMIELKTERGSHRANQIPGYFELGRHHYPDLRIDVTYVTPEMPAVTAPSPGESRFAHLTWGQVMPLVSATWGNATGTTRALHDALGEAIASIGTPWNVWRETTLGDAIALAGRLAELTAQDGQQRALDHDPGSLEALHELRIAVRDRLDAVDGSRGSVTPWLWNESTSGGAALTEQGRIHGYELRLSRGGLGADQAASV